LKIVAQQLTVADAAERYGLSRRHLHRLLACYREGGIAAVDPRSRRLRTNPAATPPEVVGRIIQLRTELLGDGLDASAGTINPPTRTSCTRCNFNASWR
jgi:hypothetical protein